MDATRPPPLTGVLCTNEGATVYLVDGLLHRNDGPAVTYADGRTENWIRGVFQPCRGVSLGTARDYVALHLDGQGDHLLQCLLRQSGQMTRADHEALKKVTSFFEKDVAGAWKPDSFMAWMSNETRASAACRALQALNPDAPPVVSPKRRDLHTPRSPPSPMEPLPPPAYQQPSPPPYEASGYVTPEAMVDQLCRMKVALEHVKTRLQEFCRESNHNLRGRDLPSTNEISSYADKNGSGCFLPTSLVDWGRRAGHAKALHVILLEALDKDYRMK